AGACRSTPTLNGAHEEPLAQVGAMKRRCSDARPSTFDGSRYVVAAARPRRLRSRQGGSLRCFRFEPVARAGIAGCYSENLRGPGPDSHLTGRWSGPAIPVAALAAPSEPAAHLQR